MAIRVAAFALACRACSGLHLTVPPLRRRDAILGFAAATSSACLPAHAAETVKVYFGAGCFWHVQHELFGEEIGSLQRSPMQATVVTGYAGGRGQSADGRVCYHNKEKVGDYGKLGHAEVVQVEIPASAYPQFCTKFFSLFGKEGLRHDPKDRGGEYRSVLGLPGGETSPMYAAVTRAAAASPGGMTLARGQGDDPDTFNEKLVYVYDSNAFPFYPAELYHQFHNDYFGNIRPGEPVTYGKDYNTLQRSLSKAGVLADTGCPAPPRYML
jgi:peptide methionine sulfoxide reductase MsrA